MSTAVAKQIFEAIENQYVVDGTIDLQNKEMLAEEMIKFVGGDKFVQQISEVFQKLEDDDDDDASSRSAGAVVTARRKKLKFNVALKVFNLFQFSCTEVKTPMDNGDNGNS